MPLRSLCLCLCLAACASDPERSEPVSPMRWKPAVARAPLALDAQGEDPNVRSALPRNSRLPLAAPPAAPAPGQPKLVLPDGTVLPALNGVLTPPKVKANRPVPRITAIVIDERGMEWYEHTDGSMTSCRYVWNEQRKRWEPVSFHAEPIDEQRG